MFRLSCVHAQTFVRSCQDFRAIIFRVILRFSIFPECVSLNARRPLIFHLWSEVTWFRLGPQSGKYLIEAHRKSFAPKVIWKLKYLGRPKLDLLTFESLFDNCHFSKEMSYIAIERSLVVEVDSFKDWRNKRTEYDQFYENPSKKVFLFRLRNPR